MHTQPLMRPILLEYPGACNLIARSVQGPHRFLQGSPAFLHRFSTSPYQVKRIDSCTLLAPFLLSINAGGSRRATALVHAQSKLSERAGRKATELTRPRNPSARRCWPGRHGLRNRGGSAILLDNAPTGEDLPCYDHDPVHSSRRAQRRTHAGHTSDGWLYWSSPSPTRRALSLRLRPRRPRTPR